MKLQTSIVALACLATVASAGLLGQWYGAVRQSGAAAPYTLPAYAQTVFVWEMGPTNASGYIVDGSALGTSYLYPFTGTATPTISTNGDGTSWYFDGANDGMTNVTFNFSSWTNWTINVWLSYGGANATYAYTWSMSAAGGLYGLGRDYPTANRFRFVAGNTVTYEFQANQDLVTNYFTMVTLVQSNNAGAVLYTNGVYAGSGTGQKLNEDGPLYVGKYFANDTFSFKGWVAYMAGWRATNLTAAQIADIYANQKGAFGR